MKLRDFRTVKDLKGKRVLVRVDFNVPLRQAPNGKGYEVDPHGDWRIRRSLPTIQKLSDAGAVVILATHVGRPGGTVHEELRVRPMGYRLSALLREEGVPNEVIWTNFERHEGRKGERQILIAPDCIGVHAEEVIDHAREGDIVLLENIRFHAGEEANDIEFAKALSSSADYFINDQLGMSHRKHASVAAITALLPHYAGTLLIDEVEHLERITERAARPFTLILGGAKITTKMPLLAHLLPLADHVHIGGAAANTLLSYAGKPVGKSVVALGHESVQKLPGWEKVKLPVDAVVAKDASGTAIRTCAIDEVRPDEYIFDVGPETCAAIEQDAAASKLVVWNGPLGYFEVPNFAKMTERLARAMAEWKNERIIGGGDTEDVVEKVGVRDRMSFVSTGGGAMLSFLSGEELPGITPLIVEK